MASKSSVVARTNAVLAAKEINSKLDALARAIAELATYIDEIEDAIRRMDRKIN